MTLIIDVQKMAALGESGFPATFPGQMGMSLERLERLELDSGLPLAHMVFTGQRAGGRWEDIGVVFRSDITSLMDRLMDRWNARLKEWREDGRADTGFPDFVLVALVPFPDRFIDIGKLPLTLDSCSRRND